VAISKDALTLGCRSVPLPVEIEQIVSYPAITGTQINANTNCSGATANGSVQLNIDGAVPENNYSFAWFEGSSTTAPVLGTNTAGVVGGSGEIASNLPAGFYTVEVTNTTAVSTGCATVATFQVFENPPVITIPTADLSVTDVTLCSNPNGAAVVVNGIAEGTGAGNIADYTFSWSDANGNILPDAVTPNTSPSISNLPAGTYYVMATKNAGTAGLSCATALIEFEIEDKTIGSVNVDLINIVQPTRCLQPANVAGELHASASGNSVTGYTYSWYQGPDTSSPPVSNSASLTGIVIPAGQSDITFTVEVLNNSNNCSITETFTLPLEIVPVEITASTTPLTFCDQDNGTVFANVTSAGNDNYEYQWFIGAVVNATPDFTGKYNNDLPAGDYTVVAIDNTDAFCTSIPKTVTIENAQIIPAVTAEAEGPLTICDPARPDGAASASVSRDVINYHFDWYEGTSSSGIPVFSGSDINNLKGITYTVVATDIVTGCSGSTQITIEQDILPVPLPQVFVLSHVTSCVESNGMLEASVDGNTSDYIFHWYHSDPGQQPDTTDAEFRSEIYGDLASGTYYVSATSRITGCISGPANNTILDAPVFPEFDFKVEPATCNGEDGYLAIFMLNEVDIRTVVWDVNGSSIPGPTLQGIPAGTYSVTVTSTLGCSETKSMEVGTEIRPFNGISRNGDGQNEIFHINCIDSFPNNIVKIFNRAGTLVYESEGYDNIDIYFDGKSNRGISLIGSNLPDGTYFYIIDKRNGSKPIAGYLEIVN